MYIKFLIFIILLGLLLLSENIYEKFSITNRFLFKYKVYWINLNRSIERRIYMENQFKKYNLIFNKRIIAIDGNNLYPEKYNYILNNNNKFKNNEIACTLSHLKAINCAIENNEDICLIMEDDISLGLIPYWNMTLDSLLLQAPNDWEVLNVSVSNPDELEEHKLSRGKFIKWEDKHTSTLCYIINRKGLYKLKKIFNLDSNKKINFNNIMKKLDLDTIVADNIIYKVLNSFTLLYPIFTFEYFGSTIHVDQENYQNRGRELVLKYYDIKKFEKISINPIPYKIYWINLERSKTRKERMINQFKKFNIDTAFRINAINGNQLKKKSKMYFHNNKNSNYYISNKLNKKHSSYEIACTLSHFKCILEAYHNNDELCLIMEDDISFDYMSKWKYTLKKLINKFPKNWEIINLSMTNHEIIKKVLKTSNKKSFHSKNLFINWNLFHYGAVCYMINRKGIKKIIDKFDLLNSPNFMDEKRNIVADEIIYKYLKSYTLKLPLFITNSDGDSTIHNNHKNYQNRGRLAVINHYNKLKFDEC